MKRKKKILICVLSLPVILLGLMVLLTLLGFHGDNWSEVVITGQVVDAETGRPIAGTGYIERYWVDDHEFTGPYDRDPYSLDTPLDGQTDGYGRFEYRRNLHWAVCPMSLFFAPEYQPLELFLRAKGYQERFLDVSGVKVRYGEVPGQVVEVGVIGLTPRQSDSE